MRVRIVFLLTSFFALMGCNSPVREEVVEFNSVGIVQAKNQLSREELKDYAESYYEDMESVVGPGGVLVIIMLDTMSGDWFSSNIGDQTREGAPYRYYVKSLSGKIMEIVSKFSGFETGDCVFVSKVSGEWRMGYANTCKNA